MSVLKRSQRRRKERTVYDPSNGDDIASRRKADNAESKVKDQVMRGCYDIIVHIMNMPQALPFNEPVNWKLLNLPDYPIIVKKPMDFGTIKERILLGKVKTIEQFGELTKLVFENAMKYNRDDSLIYQDAQFLQQEFESMFSNIYTKLVTTEYEEMSLEIPSKNQDFNEEDIAEIKKLNEMVERLEKENEKCAKAVEDERRKLSRLEKSRVKKVSLTTPRKPLTYEEKEHLCKKITELEPAHLTLLLDLISNQSQNDMENDEIEIDIENLDDSTLLKVQSFVNKHSTTEVV